MEETPFEYWRLSKDLTINQVALLIIGIDPSGEVGANCQDWPMHERPRGYEAVKTAISNAILHDDIKGKIIPLIEYDTNGDPYRSIDGTVNTEDSTVEIESLKAWMVTREVATGFFFPSQKISETPGYLDPCNSRYSRKLAAAVNAWLSVEDAAPGKSTKQTLERWLREHAARFDLTNEDGNPVDAAMFECATVANWKTKGGANETPS